MGCIGFPFGYQRVYPDFRGVKGSQTSVITTIELVECGQEEESGGSSGEEEAGAGEADLCENVDCDDGSVCTEDICRKGVCVYRMLDEVECGEGMACQSGGCVSTIEEEEKAAVPAATGFFGLGEMQDYGLIIALILGILGIVLTGMNLRKKQN